MKAILLWTGGKDSFLALQEARRRRVSVRGLVTFAPPRAEFRAHPLAFIRLQAQAIGLDHRVLTIEEPWHDNYKSRLAAAVQELAADSVWTGDIGEIAGHPNLITELCSDLGLPCERPLWQRDRRELLDLLVSSAAEVVVSCVRVDVLGREWVGRCLDQQAMKKLQQLAGEQGFDVCGEQGEYHTLVCDAPGFRWRVRLSALGVEERDGLATLAKPSFTLCEKAAA